jgi:hypothetical protein
MPHRSVDRLYVSANATWQERKPRQFTCAWCGHLVASRFGVDFGLFEDGSGQDRVGCGVRACTNCGYPSFIDGEGEVTPAVPYGEGVANAPEQLSVLYQEARDCISVGANHAAVMVCRKLLMHVAVERGAKENESYRVYVDYLVEQHLVPPETDAWVDEIRQIGNDANHEIFEIDAGQARSAVDFAAMLLKLLYDFPARGNSSVAARAEKDATG